MKLEAVWVLKAHFQVSLGYRCVAEFQGILQWKKNETLMLKDAMTGIAGVSLSFCAGDQ